MSRDISENVPSTSRMYTPRTPRLQERQRFDLTIRPEEDEEDEISGLENVVSQTWNIYAISALFGFQRDDVQLKLYSKKLREEIASTLSREDVTYDADFSILEDMFRPDEENHPAIKIEVVAKISGRSDEDIKKPIYTGMLLSWRTTQIEPNIQNFVRLPLLLCRGIRSCIDAVHTIIGRMFDCSTITLPAMEDDLSWLIPIIIMPTSNSNGTPVDSGQIQMEYAVSQLPVTDTITVKFHISDLQKILTAIMNPNDDSMINTALDRKHVEMFYDVLHTQMLRMGDLQLGLCTLRKISLPGVTITNNRMKVMNMEIMNRILLYLNEKAFDTFHTLHINV